MIEEPNTKRILLVCTGNICRSPLAAALLERALVERGIEGIAVTSAGTGCMAALDADKYLERAEAEPFVEPRVQHA